MRFAIALAASLLLFSAQAPAHSLDGRLLLNVICEYESRGSKNPEEEISHAGAVGFCQVRVTTARWLGYRGRFSVLLGDREVNMFWAWKMVLKCLRRWHSTPYRIAFCYHAGVGARVPRVRINREKLKSHWYAIQVARRYGIALKAQASRYRLAFPKLKKGE